MNCIIFNTHAFFFFSKENTVLRARVSHHRVSVIPNAVDTTAFVPKLELRTQDKSNYFLYLPLIFFHIH